VPGGGRRFWLVKQTNPAASPRAANCSSLQIRALCRFQVSALAESSTVAPCYRRRRGDGRDVSSRQDRAGLRKCALRRSKVQEIIESYEAALSERRARRGRSSRARCAASLSLWVQTRDLPLPKPRGLACPDDQARAQRRKSRSLLAVVLSWSEHVSRTPSVLGALRVNGGASRMGQTKPRSIVRLAAPSAAAKPRAARSSAPTRYSLFLDGVLGGHRGGVKRSRAGALAATTR